MTAIELDIANHQLASIAEEMGTALMQAAFSANIKERRDYSCALFDANGDMLAQAAHIPVHLGSAPLSVQEVIQAVTLGPDEMGIVNDPYAGGTHLPDITVVAPVYVPAQPDRPLFYVANRAHHADVGGASPGSMPLVSHIDDEGVRLAPQRWTDEVERRFLAQARSPVERRGDLAAQRAANRVGARRLTDWIESRGVEEALRTIDALFGWSERWMGSVLQGLTPGEHRAEDQLEDDGLGHGPIAIAATLQVHSAPRRISIDFSDCADQVPGPLNAVRAIAVSAVAYALRCLAGPELPSNNGFMRSVDVRTRVGSVADAVYPAAVSAGNVETSQRLADVVFRVLALAAPQRVPAASCGSMNNVLFGGISSDGTEFTYYETLAGGAGAGPQGPGASGVHTHMTNTLNTPVEALEHAYPVRVERYALRENSGGAGRFAGGDGIVRRYRFLAPATVTLVGERRKRGAPGAEGGLDGEPGQDWWHRPGAEPIRLASKCTFDVVAGESIEIRTPGGGGYGAPAT